MNTKKTIKEIVQKIVNEGYIGDGNYYVIKIADDGSWVIEQVSSDYPAEIEYVKVDNYQFVYIPLSQYEDEQGIVEDERDALTLDLSYILAQWEQKLKFIKAGQRGGQNNLKKHGTAGMSRAGKARKSEKKKI
jgi:DNA topoisomerase IA